MRRRYVASSTATIGDDVLVRYPYDMLFAVPARLLLGWKDPGEDRQRRAFS